MGQWLTRKALYDLVWSEPLRTLAPRFAISDVALRKTCQRAMIPTPERGYWARKEAGKKTWTVPLPERPPAMENDVEIGGGNGYYYRSWTNEELLGPLPAPPEFDSALESVRERIVKIVGKVTVAREVTSWHPAVSRLLMDDEKRREKARASSYVLPWDKPQFDSPEAQRKLRILNALFFATGRCHARSRPERDAVRSCISLQQQHLWIKLAPSPSKGKKDNEKLTLAIIDGYGSDREIRSWSDGDEGKLEKQLAEIAIEIVYRAEVSYRETVERRFAWRKEREAELEEELQRKKLAAEQAERERIAKLQKERIEKLLGQAAAFEQARTIRKYIEAIRNALAGSVEFSAERIDAWASWALGEADRIDPSLNGRFLETFDPSS